MIGLKITEKIIVIKIMLIAIIVIIIIIIKISSEIYITIDKVMIKIN